MSNYFFNDERINIARGLLRGVTSEHKFGAVPAMSQNNTGTIWDVNDTLYPWSAFDTAGVVSIVSDDTEDDEDKGGGTPGTGAHKITIVGLDDNYELVTEELTTNGTVARTGTQSFKRVYRAFVSEGSANAGTIDVKRGSTVVARINETKSQTLMAVYTVPAGYTAYLTQGTATIQSGADATGDMFIRYFGQDAFRIGHSFEVSGTGGQYLYEFSVPRVIPEKSDIDVRASVRSNNARATAAFDIILKQN